MQEITVTMRKEKETTNAIRYAEQAEAGSPPMLKNVYLPKWYFNGDVPQEITVTVSAN